MNKKTVLLLPVKLWEAIREKAFSQRISMSEYIRRAVSEKIQKDDTQVS